MTQLVFIHGPGASGCAAAWIHQLRHFPGSVAPTLPGNPDGTHCPDITRAMEWVRGWLWAQGMRKDLVLVGYTLGAAIALQYALDYPDEVKGLVLSAVSVAPRGEARSGLLDNCLKAASGNPEAYEKWLDFHRQIPGGHFVTEQFIAHHGRSIARWRMVAGDGTTLGDGMSYGEYDGDGRLLTMTGFFEPPSPG